MARLRRRVRRTGLRVESPVHARVPATLRIRTRVLASWQDKEVLWALGRFLGGLVNVDLAATCRLGDVSANDIALSWAERKQALTGVTSSRWAGAITKEVHRTWPLPVPRMRDTASTLTPPSTPFAPDWPCRLGRWAGIVTGTNGR